MSDVVKTQCSPDDEIDHRTMNKTMPVMVMMMVVPATVMVLSTPQRIHTKGPHRADPGRVPSRLLCRSFCGGGWCVYLRCRCCCQSLRSVRAQLAKRERIEGDWRCLAVPVLMLLQSVSESKMLFRCLVCACVAVFVTDGVVAWVCVCVC